MTAEKYVRDIVRQLKCDNKRKREIRMQLLSDIKDRVSGGESLEAVLQQMGGAAEVAQGFNEGVSEAEQRLVRKKRKWKIAGICVVLLTMLVAGGYWFLPKMSPIEGSKVFVKETLEAQASQTAAYMAKGEYGRIREYATAQMQEYLNAEYMDDAKAMLSQDWGVKVQDGACYMQEIVQQGQHAAIVQTTVVYENVVITYTFVFDTDMKLTGLYMK